MSERDQAYYRHPVWLLTPQGWLPAWGEEGLRYFVVIDDDDYERERYLPAPAGHGSLRPRDPNDAGGGDRPGLTE